MPVSKAQQKAVNKYNKAHYDRIALSLPAGYKDKIKSALSDGESINSFIKKCIDSALTNTTTQAE